MFPMPQYNCPMSLPIAEFTMSDLWSKPFLYGLLIGAVLLFLVWVIVLCIRKSRMACKKITVPDSEKGNFSISANALETFVEKVAESFPEVQMSSLKLVSTRTGLNMNIALRASEDANLLEIRKELRDRIFSELEKRLGIASEISEVNFNAVDFKNFTQVIKPTQLSQIE